MKTDYDYIIAGCGAAGLSLVYRILLEPELSGSNILLIDKDQKESNDRTWCFWENGEDIFEPIIFHSWDELKFHSRWFSKMLDLQPFSYKMIRGIDFYKTVKKKIAEFENVKWLHEEVNDVTDQKDHAIVVAGDNKFTANYVFSSLRDDNEENQAKDYHYLLQHFKGWVIQTETDYFNPEKATLMDFRVDQNGDCRFMYLLPTDERKALLEYTVFSKSLLDKDEYDHHLKEYLNDIDEFPGYNVVHEEFGIIPMSDIPFKQKQGDHVINIGTAGGYTKPSTGYTFKRIQDNTRSLVDLLKKGKPPHLKSTYSRFMLYDSTLLHVMEQNWFPADKIFTRLFQKNKPKDVFTFLDENTTFFQELKIMQQMPPWPFMKAMAAVLIKRMKL